MSASAKRKKQRHFNRSSTNSHRSSNPRSWSSTQPHHKTDHTSMWMTSPWGRCVSFSIIAETRGLWWLMAWLENGTRG
jgi:hypothetical protein